jgi:hypothetical protein
MVSGFHAAGCATAGDLSHCFGELACQRQAPATAPQQLKWPRLSESLPWQLPHCTDLSLCLFEPQLLISTREIAPLR